MANGRLSLLASDGRGRREQQKHSYIVTHAVYTVGNTSIVVIVMVQYGYGRMRRYNTTRRIYATFIRRAPYTAKRSITSRRHRTRLACYGCYASRPFVGVYNIQHAMASASTLMTFIDDITGCQSNTRHTHYEYADASTLVYRYGHIVTIINYHIVTFGCYAIAGLALQAYYAMARMTWRSSWPLTTDNIGI